MTLRYSHAFRALYGRPWAITEAMLDTMCEILDYRISGGILTDQEITARIQAASNGPRAGGKRAGAVAIIPVYGVISQRAGMMANSSGGTSVEGITQAFRQALADPEVASIIFDVDSPGGSVDGITELAAEIRGARGQKPMATVANTLMASAAYWGFLGVDEVIASPSSQIGSVGVIARHVDDTKAREAAGISRTVIAMPPSKADGFDGDAISAEGVDEIRSSVEQFYAMFVGDVAKARGVSVETVRSDYGKGRVLLAKPALAAGMVDRIDTLDATIQRAMHGRLAFRSVGSPALPDAGAYLLPAGISAGPLPSHGSPTDEDPWDGQAEEAKIPNDAGAAVLETFYAWRDDAADPDKKAAYKFIHHRGGAEAGPASTEACSMGIGVLNGGRQGTTVPEADHSGIHAHLAAHMKDAGMDAPPLSSADPAAALDTGLPFGEHVALVSAQLDALVVHARSHVDMRAREGRTPSRASAEQLARLSERNAELLGLLSTPGVDDRAAGRARAMVAEARIRGGRLTSPSHK